MEPVRWVEGSLQADSAVFTLLRPLLQLVLVIIIEYLHHVFFGSGAMRETHETR